MPQDPEDVRVGMVVERRKFLFALNRRMPQDATRPAEEKVSVKFLFALNRRMPQDSPVVVGNARQYEFLFALNRRMPQDRRPGSMPPCVAGFYSP